MDYYRAAVAPAVEQFSSTQSVTGLNPAPLGCKSKTMYVNLQMILIHTVMAQFGVQYLA